MAKKAARKTAQPVTLADALRQAIRDSGRSHNSIAIEAGIPASGVDRFMAGRDIRLMTAEKIMAAIGCVLCLQRSANSLKSLESK